MVGANSRADSLAAQRPDRPTLLYDDGCRFCRAMAELLGRAARGHELALLPWSAEAAAAWMAEMSPEVRERSMHLKLPDGGLVSGNPVLVATLRHVRGLKWMARLCRQVPLASRGVAGCYGFVARHRNTLSKLVPNRPAVVREPGLL